MSQYTVDVMIPTYKPGQEFAELLPRLLEQTYPIRSIRVVNTGKKFWNPAWEQLSDKIMVEHIRPSEFDHGGTRRAMAESSDADLLLFMTQDAMPVRQCVRGTSGGKIFIAACESGLCAAASAG